MLKSCRLSLKKGDSIAQGPINVETTPKVTDQVKSNDRTEQNHTTTTKSEVTARAQTKESVVEENTESKKSVAPIASPNPPVV